jgi:hypothetical protein
VEGRNVGAGILSIITESLYDKPIVVFREYVQNSVDSFIKAEKEGHSSELSSRIWYEGDNLFFLDNGSGVAPDKFYDEMKSIGKSHKHRRTNLGYKGIGRLSGLSYCKELIFINICNYKEDWFQKYHIDGPKYIEMKSSTDIQRTFDEIMDEIGTYTERVSDTDLNDVKQIIAPFSEMFTKQNTGFLVILGNITSILAGTIAKEDFLSELGWLLPVKFSEELLESKQKTLFENLTEPSGDESIIPARSFNVTFNEHPLERPIHSSMLRYYTCKTDYTYAVGFHTFNRDKIASDRKNDFSGIRLYIDNVLLCDESELIPILISNGLLNGSVHEMVQAVRGIGAMIYITDKINISANARRTFIELTDDAAFKFLELIALFVNNVQDARYDLSRYNSQKSSAEQSQEKLVQLKERAVASLRKLAAEQLVIEPDVSSPTDFSELKLPEQKKIIRKKLTSYTNQRVKEYLIQTSSFELESAVDDFKTWLNTNL